MGFDGLLSNPHAPSDILSLLPSRRQATQLWQTYLNNVDGLLKLLHVPTVQPSVFAAINSPKDTPADMIALLFSIYFAAVTSPAFARPAGLPWAKTDRPLSARISEAWRSLCTWGPSWTRPPSFRCKQWQSIW